MKDLLLNGTWSYRVGAGTIEHIEVPFSRLPVGRSECTHTFDLPLEGKRFFLKFDGITYYATVSLNGVMLGEMLPYCEYEFEITGLAKPQGNLLSVTLEDIDRAFGPSEGWENFGGIIRDVHLLTCDEYRIRDVFFKSTLQNDYRDADFELEIAADAPMDARVRIRILDGPSPVATLDQPLESLHVGLLKNVRLWSSAGPNLYTLAVVLVCNGISCDSYTCKIGFREITCDRHRFYLNGTPIFFKGLCKHEMVADSGHCPTDDQMEADMQQIKDMGCNFVRLVHYPHNKKILEIADRLGLFVSEEPGLWWSDTSNEEIAEGSKEVLRRTILRDRNHPSIAFWLCFNECQFTERFLTESAAICRQYDPTRMVSGANCMSLEDTLLYYNKCGFDFYTMHPYSDTFAKAQRSAEVLCDKPLIFTEWGGYFVYNNPHLLADFMEQMRKLYLHASDNGALAGAFFWFFAELNDFNRGEPACTDGILHEGLVDINRNPTLIYDAFCRGMKRAEEPDDPTVPFWYQSAVAFEDLAGHRALNACTEASADDMLAPLLADAAVQGCKRKRKITTGPVLDLDAPLSPIPHVATPQQPLCFVGGGKTDRLTLIGMTALSGGYPLGGGLCKMLGEISITYQNGTVQAIPLQNGIHVTTVLSLNGSSRIDPIASSAPRFATFGYDKNFEVYVANRLDISVDPEEEIEKVTVTASCDEHPLTVYAVLART